MKIAPTDTEDYEFLRQSAELAEARGLPNFDHLKEPIARWNYIRIANEVAVTVGKARLLDWGCGYGQMTYLLRRRGLEVTACDIGNPEAALPDVPLCRGLGVQGIPHPYELPFADASFDAVLSCGVLEHVEDDSPDGSEARSLSEIRRVLRPEGFLLIYYLPQRASWQEALTRRLDLGYSHSRRFTCREISDLLRTSGYRVKRVRRANLFPRNLPAAPSLVRKLYGAMSRPLLAADAILCSVPGLNRIAGVLEIVAQRA